MEIFSQKFGSLFKAVIFAVRFARSGVFFKQNAGVAQLVERHLAKVEVAGSSLVSRSKIKGVQRESKTPFIV